MSDPKRKAMAYFVVRREIEARPGYRAGSFDRYAVSRAWREVMPDVLRAVPTVVDYCMDEDGGPCTTLLYDKGKTIEDWFAAFFVASLPTTDGGPECGLAAPVMGDIKAALDSVTRRMVEDIERDRAEREEWDRRLEADPSLRYIQTTALNPKTGEETP